MNDDRQIAVNSAVGQFWRLQKGPKLISYHSNVSSTTAKIISVYDLHTWAYQCWNVGEVRSSTCWENSRKYLSFGEMIANIGPVDPEIICLKLKKEEITKVKYIARSAT